MLGVLVVTHGDFAEELVKAVRVVVGEVENMEAVSIGWDDDVGGATAAIEQAVQRVDRGDGVLLLTDMFGGTPTNLALAMLEPGKVEIVTGVNLPMLIKCTNLRAEEDLHTTAVKIADEARGAIQVAGQVLHTPRDEDPRDVIEAEVQVPNELGLHARAAARFVHLANRFDSRILVRNVNREGAGADGKSILGLLTLAAARGSRLLLSVDGADEREAVNELVRLVEGGFGEGGYGEGGFDDGARDADAGGEGG